MIGREFDLRKMLTNYDVTWWHCINFINTIEQGISMEQQLTAFLYPEQVLWIAAFTIGGLSFALGPIAIVYLLMPLKTRQINNKALQFIECGMDPIGDSWIRYGVVFYLYALIFLSL